MGDGKLSTDKASLQLRAQEIINAHPEGMTTRAALKQAILERYQHNADALADVAVSFAGTIMSNLVKATHNLPDDNGTLFQIPGVIGIRSEDGDLLIARDHADLDQVRQWVREGLQHHSTQRLRFKRANAELESLKDEDGSLPWWSARAMLAQGEDDE